MRNFRVMLMRNDNCIYANRLESFVFDSNLTLCIRAEPRNCPCFTKFRCTAQNVVRIDKRCRHKFRRFAARKTEHHSLITCALLSLEFFKTSSFNPLCNVGRLCVNSVHKFHLVSVKAEFFISIANVACNTSRN